MHGHTLLADFGATPKFILEAEQLYVRRYGENVQDCHFSNPDFSVL